MTTAHETDLLGAYVLGVLDGDDWATVEQHLAGCEACRREVADLRLMEASLGEIPPEAFLDGPPPDADLLLQKTLAQVRDESRGRARRKRLLLVAAAVAVAIAALGAGMLTGRFTADPPAPVATASAAAARTGSATDAGTGATMTVAVQPAAGWVRLHATVGGIAAGEECRLYVVGRDGSRQQAGSWLVSETGAAAGTTLDGSALMAPDEVAGVQAETYAGRVLVAVAL